jgi:hypothetical protein
MTVAPPREDTAHAVLSERLHDPAIAAALASLLDHAELLAVLVEGLDEFVARTEVIGDSLLSSFGDLRSIVANNESLAKAGVDLDKLKDAATSLAVSDLFKPEMVEQLGLLSRGVVKGGQQYTAAPVEVGGILSMTRLLKDPDIKRAISFFATLAKSLGQELDAPSNTKLSN